MAKDTVRTDMKKIMKQKPETGSREDQSPPSSLSRDFFGLLLIGFAVFSLVALTSFSPGDPSFNNFVSTEMEAKNLGGRVGACLADGLAQVFGAGAFIFPLITALLGWAVIRGRAFPRWRVVLFFGTLFMAAFCSLLYVQYPGDPWFGTAAYAGGMTGAYFGPYLITWFNVSGAHLVLGIFLTICLLAMFNISVNALVDGTKKRTHSLFAGMANGARSAGQGLKQGAFSTSSRFMEWRNIMRQAKEERGRAKKQNAEPVIVARIPEIPRSEPVISKPVLKKKAPEKPKEEFPVDEEALVLEEYSSYRVPPLELLNNPQEVTDIARMREEILHNSQILERKLADFGIEGKVVQVLPGPVITLYEYEPAPGIKVSRILSLTDDLALAMRAPSVRILAPVPGKSVVGIELPNPKREIVTMKEIMRSDEFEHTESKLAMVLGKDNIGNPVVQDLAQVPHLLMAGSTGSGKSVGINAMICSLLLNATPDEVKLIMIDPKMLELSMYDGIPHLIAPVVTNPKKAAAALQWAVSEMEARYKVMAEKGVRNVRGFNDLVAKLEDERAELEQKRARQVKYKKKMGPIKPEEAEAEVPEEETEEEPLPEVPARLPYVVIIIDELADLMMVASKGVEDSLTRLAQMARAAGIHLIVATQRPSVDVLTGIIKANFPARISYQVTSRVDSRTILDSMGAEKLLGKGDMLFLPPGTSRLRRIHGAMVSDEEVNRLLAFIKKQKVKPQYQDDVFEQAAIEEEKKVEAEEEYDELYDQALAIVARERQASISMIQRRLRIGYNRAARIIEIMERDGAVGPSDGVKPREVYVNEIPLE